MHSKFLVSAAAGALLAMTGAAFAQSAVVATTDLNVRAGPGPAASGRRRPRRRPVGQSQWLP